REVVERPRSEPPPPARVVSRPGPSRMVRSVPVALSSRAGRDRDRTPISRPAEVVPTAVPVPAPPATAESWLLRASRLVISRAPWIWPAGVLILTARLILTGLALSRLVRRSEAAPDAIAQECRAIAAQLGCTHAVRVVRSAEVATPCL